MNSAEYQKCFVRVATTDSLARSLEETTALLDVFLQHGFDVNGRCDKTQASILLKIVLEYRWYRDVLFSRNNNNDQENVARGRQRCLASLEYLLAHGADPNDAHSRWAVLVDDNDDDDDDDENYANALVLAMTDVNEYLSQDTTILELLLRFGANPNQALQGRPASLLERAIGAEHQGAIELLLQHGARPNTVSEYHLSKILGATGDDSHCQRIALLLLDHANALELLWLVLCKIISYASHERARAVQFLLLHQPRARLALLHQVIQKGNSRLTEFLLRNGCMKLNGPEYRFLGSILEKMVSSSSEMTSKPLQSATSTSLEESKTKAAEPSSLYLIHHAIGCQAGERCAFSIVKMLLDQQDLEVDVNFPDDQGHSPIWKAAKSGNVHLTRILLQNGANATVQGPQSPLFAALLAPRGKKQRVVELLLNEGKADAAASVDEHGNPIWFETARRKNVRCTFEIIIEIASRGFFDQLRRERE